MRSADNKSQPKAVAVYTDGEGIGDGIIKMPFACAIKSAFPCARLTWLTVGKTVYSDVLRELSSSAIDEIVTLPRSSMRIADFAFGNLLPDRHFDVLIDTQTNLRRSLWLKRQISHETFVSASARFFLSNVPPAYPVRSPLVIDHLMRLASSAAQRPLLPIPVSLSDPKWQAAAKILLPNGKRYIGFIVGAGHPKKCWPLANFLRLATANVALGFTPAFLLGPGERGLQEEIASKVPEAVFPLSSSSIASSDAASPLLTIALASRLLVAVANDSGGGHLVAAGGPPMLTLFRSPFVRGKFMPSAPRVIALAPQDFGGERMEDIPFDAAAEALAELIAYAQKQPAADE
jgi:ADP-heptose:LPS heptosyltransferase